MGEMLSKSDWWCVLINFRPLGADLGNIVEARSTLPVGLEVTATRVYRTRSNIAEGMSRTCTTFS